MFSPKFSYSRSLHKDSGNVRYCDICYCQRVSLTCNYSQLHVYSCKSLIIRALESIVYQLSKVATCSHKTLKIALNSFVVD